MCLITKMLEKTLKKTIHTRQSKSKLLADKGYSNEASIEIAKKYNMELLAPNKKNFKTPKFPINSNLKGRYVVEALNSWIKNFKRIILRYERFVKYYNSYLLLAFSMVTYRIR